MYAVRIESFCINVNILYASTVDTVAFMKVKSLCGGFQLTSVNVHHSSLKEKRNSIIFDILTKMLQYSISQNNQIAS